MKYIILPIICSFLTLNIYANTHTTCKQTGRKGLIIYQYSCSNFAIESQLQSTVLALNDFVSDKHKEYRKPIYIQWGYASEVELFYENFFGENGNHSLALAIQEESIRKVYKPGILPDTSQKYCIKLILPNNFKSRQNILLLIDYAIRNEPKLISLFNKFGVSQSDNYENLTRQELESILNNHSKREYIQKYIDKEYKFKKEDCKLVFVNDNVKVKCRNRIVSEMNILDNLILVKGTALLLFKNDSTFRYYNVKTRKLGLENIITGKKNRSQFELSKVDDNSFFINYFYYEYPRINGKIEEALKYDNVEFLKNTGEIIGRKKE